MNQRRHSIEWLVWGALGLTIAGIVAAFVWKQVNEPGRDGRLPAFFHVPDFVLTNQDARPVTLADLRGHLWLADIIFTRCGGPCPQMTRTMATLQAGLPSNAPVKLITLTTDPEYDTPKILKEYARSAGARSDRWQFLTGATEQIGRLAIDGLKFTALPQEPKKRTNDRDLFIHSTTIVLVDGAGWVRGSFETTSPDSPHEILQAVKKLLREKPN